MTHARLADPAPGTCAAARPADAAAALLRLLAAHRRWMVLTGAGISTASGIPSYRDGEGRWMRKAPVTHQEFLGSHAVRQRYWARSLHGWPMIAAARPNAAHAALAALERHGRVAAVVTQNVDGLHQRAGSTCVIDLHGRVDEVTCVACAARQPREWLQERLVADNPGMASDAAMAPDGDADVEADFGGFRVPACACGGVLKPDVVFFGANVPRARVDAAMATLDAADLLLVVGTSLMAYSGYRFCERARATGRPIVAINAGRTRADDLLALKVEADCLSVLPAVADALAPRP